MNQESRDGLVRSPVRTTRRELVKCSRPQGGGVVTGKGRSEISMDGLRANFERREEVIEVESYCNLSVRESLPMRLIRRLKGNAGYQL